MKFSQMLGSISLAILMLVSNSSFAVLASTRNAEPEDGEDKVKISPEITIDDNKLKPSITFAANKGFSGSENWRYLFEFRANSGIDVGSFENPSESSEEIISEYVADGGNIEFEPSIMWRTNGRKISISGSGFYSLLTTDAISTQQDSSSVISVDAEVYGFKIEAAVKFTEITGFFRAATYDTSDDGVNADFTEILDDGHSFAFGIDLPLSALSGSTADTNGYVLRLERTKHSEVERAIFRVSIARAFNLFE
jgi:hypothetical protein